MLISEMEVYNSKANVVNDNMNSFINDLKLPKKNLELDTRSTNTTKELLEKAKNSQHKYVVLYEKSPKKYNALKKYGEVLKLVEKLIGLIPTNLDNLSLEELTNKLEELVKSRQKNMNQMSFTYYQNMISNLMTDILSIEQDFQDGKINASQALKAIQDAKQPFVEHKHEMPQILFESMQSTQHLLSIYESTYEAQDQIEQVYGETALKPAGLEPQQKILMDKLENDTTRILKQVNSINMGLNNFQPQVDLTKLITNLKDSQDLLEKPELDVDGMNRSVENLQSTTISLTDKQIDLNHKRENLEDEIKYCTTKTTQLNALSTLHFSRETYKEANERAEQHEENINSVGEILENNVNLPSDVAKQLAETVVDSLEADQKVATIMSKNPNVDKAANNSESIQEVIDKAFELKDKVLTIEEQQEMVLKLEQQKDNENNEDDKNN
jgi:hypothetical protein